MAEDNSNKNERFEKLANAVAGGEVAMVKFLWDLITQLEGHADVPGTKIEKFQKTIDDFIADYQVKDGERGAIGPIGPRGVPGPQGPSGRDGRDGRDGEDGRDGRDGDDGKDGKQGRLPDHEWDGSKIRFEESDGEWGEWVDLRGPIGPPGQTDGMGGGFPGLEKVIAGSSVFQGVAQIQFGTGLTVTKTPNGVKVVASGGGTGFTIETPAGTVNASNTTFTPTSEPAYIVVDGVSYFAGAGYTWNGTTIECDLAPSSFIRAFI